MTFRKAQSGSVLVEAVFALSLIIIPLIGVNLEVIRGAQYQVILQEMVFRYTRYRVFHVADERARRASLFVTRAFGDGESTRMKRSAHFSFEPKSNYGEGVVVYRYPGFFPMHDRIQMTKRCRFSWSVLRAFF